MASIDAVMAALEKDITTEVVTKVLDVQAELAEAAPVDTGFLRDNFQLSVGAPADGTVPIGTLASVAAIADYKLSDGGIFITNNTNYGAAVNARGVHAGFVDAAVARGIAKS